MAQGAGAGRQAQSKFTAQARMMATTALTPEYPKIEAPTLVIGATHDALRPPEKAERVAKALKNAPTCWPIPGTAWRCRRRSCSSRRCCRFSRGRSGGGLEAQGRRTGTMAPGQPLVFGIMERGGHVGISL